MIDKTKLNSRLLYLIAWCTDFVAALLIFSVSRDLAVRGAGLLQMGLIGGIFSFFYAASSFVSGRLSDRVGSYRLIRIGVLGMMLTLVGSLFIPPTCWGYYASYFFHAVSVGMIFSPLIAALNQGRPANRAMRGISRSLIWFCLAWNLGLICGQTSGGWLFSFGRTYPIGLGLGLMHLNLIFVFLLRRNPASPFPDAEPLDEEDLKQQALGVSFANVAWIGNFGGAFAMSIITHLFPQLAVRLEVPSDQHGTILGIMQMTVVATYLFMHHSHFWHYRFSVSLGTQGFALVGLTILCLAKTTSGLLVGLVCVAVLTGYNYFSSLFYSSVGRSDGRKGFASGMHEATLGLGFAGGAMGGGIIGAFCGERSPYLLAAFVILAMSMIQIVFYFRWVHSLKKH